MTKIAWDQVGQRTYETGVDHGVLYIPDGAGVYNAGYAWNGLTAVTESPSGAAATPLYADNMKYLNLTSVEEFGGTVEAFTYPDEFAQCDGTATPQSGIAVGQQTRRTFGLCYRTRMGTDLNSDAGYKLHLIYGALAAPSEKAYGTVNETPQAITFKWGITTTPVDVPGYKPSACLTINSLKVSSTALATLEDFLYGTVGSNPSLPLPAAVLAIFAGTVTQVVPTVPAYDTSTKTITIPTITGVVYKINGAVVTGAVVITVNTMVTASPAVGYKFPAVTDDDWLITY